MNGQKAKTIRKQIYGEDYSPKFRKYHRIKDGQIVADQQRRAYQQAKKVFLKKV